MMIRKCRNLEDSERDAGVNPMKETDAPSDRRVLTRWQIEVVTQGMYLTKAQIPFICPDRWML